MCILIMLKCHWRRCCHFPTHTTFRRTGQSTNFARSHISSTRSKQPNTQLNHPFQIEHNSIIRPLLKQLEKINNEKWIEQQFSAIHVCSTIYNDRWLSLLNTFYTLFAVLLISLLEIPTYWSVNDKRAKMNCLQRSEIEKQNQQFALVD